jgi:enoyl-CoA hydratase/carnithine racemase
LLGLGDQEAVDGTTRRTRTVGYARSKELIMTARMIEEAERIGLVNRVVGEGPSNPPSEHYVRYALSE